MLNVNHVLLLEESLSTMRERLSASTKVLSDSQANKEQYRGAISLWVTDIDLIAKNSAAANEAGLCKICNIIETQLSALANTSIGSMSNYCQLLIDWIEYSLRYLQGDDDSNLLAHLLVLVPEDDHENVIANLHGIWIQESNTNNMTVEASTGDFPSLGDQTGTGEDEESDLEESLEMNDSSEVTLSAIFSMLHEELSELVEQMTGLIRKLFDPNTDIDTLQQSQETYQSLLERLALTCESLELEGLQQVCSFVDLNLTQIEPIQEAERQTLNDLFILWTERTLLYLQDPEDDQHCLSLLECLQDQHWPVSLNDDQARQLLGDLSKPISLPELYNDEPARQAKAKPEDVTTEFTNTIIPELVSAFFHESPKVAAELSHCITEIQSGIEKSFNIEAAQRFEHTLKGSANLVGVKGVANLAHHMEDILEYLLQHQNCFPENLVSTLLEAADCIETMLDFMQGKDDFPQDAQYLLQDLLDWANRIDSGSLKEFFATTPDTITALNEDKQDGDVSNDHQNIKASSLHAPPDEFINVPTRIVDTMFRMAGELSIMASQIKTGFEQLGKYEKETKFQEKLVQQHRAELEDMVNVRRFSVAQRDSQPRVNESEYFDSLEMDQYDELHGSIHGFIETVVDSTEMTHSIYNQIDKLEDLLVSQQRLHDDLQHVVMNARMVPVHTIAARLERTVRQTCRSTDKKVKLVITGQDLLIDSELLNILVTPIMHVLRNAVDHGIQTAADRTLADKEVEGNIALEFKRIGNNILVSCTDDGIGLNYERIRKIAIRNKLIEPNEALDNTELAKLILLSGFTTRDKVTQISGRGVGLNVVNTTIQSQGGTMTISDNNPSGCIVHLKTPVSLVTSHSILVRHKNEVVAIASNTLERIIPPGIGEFRSLSGQLTFHEHDKVYKLLSLESLLGFNSADKIQPYDNPSVLLTRVDHEIVAVAVDQVISSNNLVIKNLGRFVPSLPGISGVSIMGNGNVVSILDLQELIKDPDAIEPVIDCNLTLGQEIDEVPTVLVVDDSLTMRRSLSQLVADAGFQVETARDGVEAMNKIHKHMPNLVLSDMEMPRMTGLELTSQIRSNMEINHLPVVMITSRSAQKHRAQAERVGVSKYITKPFSEDKLLEVVTSMIVV